jgi:hypothetical protein
LAVKVISIPHARSSIQGRKIPSRRMNKKRLRIMNGKETMRKSTKNSIESTSANYKRI